MATIIIIISIFFRHTRKTSFLLAGKKKTKVPELGVGWVGEGGGYLIRAMPKLIPLFLLDIFPKGRHQQKMKVLIRALPELANPPPNSGTLVLFSGQQKRRFARMTEKKY